MRNNKKYSQKLSRLNDERHNVFKGEVRQVRVLFIKNIHTKHKHNPVDNLISSIKKFKEERYYSIDLRLVI